MSLENQLTKYSNKFIQRRPSEDTRQYVYRILSTLILNMVLSPGQRMNEQDLASFMNVSRTPLHDTFPKLARNNLIEVIPMRGSFVSKVSRKRIEDSVLPLSPFCAHPVAFITIAASAIAANALILILFFSLILFLNIILYKFTL